MINRKNPPVLPSLYDLKTPIHSTFYLKNGIAVHLVERNQLPVLQLRFLLHKGAAEDPVNKRGTAFLTGKLIDESAENLNSLEIDRIIQKLGASFDSGVNTIDQTFYLSSLKENLDEFLSVISKIFLKPNFRDEDFNREKAKHLDSLVHLQDDPRNLGFLVSQKYLFKETPFENSSMGTLKTVQNIENSDIKEFYLQNYIAQNLEIIAVGNVNSQELTEILEKHFGDFPSGSSSSREEIVFQVPQNQILLINKKDAPQSVINIVNISDKINSPHFYAMKVLNTIFGGQFSSRLNHNLREEKGLTYGIQSEFAQSLNMGNFSIRTSVDTANTILALKEIIREINLIREDISDEELNFAKSFLIKNSSIYDDTISYIISNIQFLVRNKLERDYFVKLSENIGKVTKSDVLEAAKKNILVDNHIIVVVGDAEKLYDELISEFPKYEIIKMEIADLDI